MLRRLVERIRSEDKQTDLPVKAVIGLGNPGPDYKDTRHNAGFMIVDEVCRRRGQTKSVNRFGASIREYDGAKEPIILAKPLTYMNRSGVSIEQLVRHYSLCLENMLVVYDELDLAFGRIQLRAGGSAGGHNGLKSVLQASGTNEVSRLRFGIGRPETGSTLDYVLGSFDDRQVKELPGLLSYAADAVELWFEQGIQSAMNKYNKRGTNSGSQIVCIKDDSTQDCQ